jgi:dTDP-4-dehydrorhamnose reductase
MHTRLNQSTFIITGANGMLGNSFAEVLSNEYPNAIVYSYDRIDLDVTNEEETERLQELQPDIILHCAAITNADHCETNPNSSKKVFEDGTKNIANLANKCGAKIFYPQSFLIFSGGNDEINENTVPNPLSVYGKHKLLAESIILDSGVESLIVRMGGFFGGDQRDKNFVGKFTRHLASLIAEGKNRYAVGSRVWQPTYTVDLARNTLLLLENERNGIWSMACEDLASFYDVADACIKILGLEDKFEITKADSKEINLQDVAKRPDVAIISNARLHSSGQCLQRNWREALEEYLRRPWFSELLKRE